MSAKYEEIQKIHAQRKTTAAGKSNHLMNVFNKTGYNITVPLLELF